MTDIFQNVKKAVLGPWVSQIFERVQTELDSSGQGLAKTTNGTLLTFGDSLTSGARASGESTRYPNRIAAATGLTLTNRGRDATQLDDLSSGGNGIWAVTLGGSYLADLAFAANDTITSMIGYNDIRQVGYNVAFCRQLRREYNGLIGWLGLADSCKRRMLNSGGTLDSTTWTFTGGSWTAFSGWGGKFGAFNTTNGATATLNSTLTGDVVQVWYGATFSNGSESGPPGIIVTIDGVDHGPYSCRSPYFNSGVWQVFGARITGLTNTAHTISIKAFSAGSGTAVIGGVACYDSSAAPACNLYVSDIPYMWIAQPTANVTAGTNTTPDGYSTQSGYTVASQFTTNRDINTQRDQAFEAYNRIIYDECRAAARAGLKVAHIDINVHYDPNGMVDRSETSALSHPQDGGYAAIAQAFLQEMRRPTFPIPY